MRIKIGALEMSKLFTAGREEEPV